MTSTTIPEDESARQPEGSCEICGCPPVEQAVASGSLLLRCPDCGHLIRDLKLCPADAREKVYGGSEQFDRFRLFFTRRRLFKLLRRFPPGEKLDVLEVGFGSGQLLRSLQEKGHRIHGVEVCRSQGPGIDQLIASGAQLYFEGLDQAELPAGSLDLVYLIHVAEHLADPVTGFRKLAQASKRGALLYLVTPNGRSSGLKVFGDHWWHLEDPTHGRFFTHQSMTACLRQAGFDLLDNKAPLMDSLSLEINSLMRLFYRRGAVMDHLLVRLLDGILWPLALLIRLIWPGIRPNMEVLARKR
jgi:2-polyprenyl-3-methyl-5-hydroxy-6-metoxy-1,4-benzoquinol methylase